MRIALGIMLLPLLAFAETEVSGAVSGVWDREGSPYLVMDSTWIEDGDTLLLTAGTEVLFDEGQGLYVWGAFSSFGEGERENGVRIGIHDGAESWMGIHYFGEGTTVLEWTGIDVPDSAIFLDNNYSLIMRHSSLRATARAIRPHSYEQDRIGRNWVLEFHDSYIYGNTELVTEGGSIIGVNSEFDFSANEFSDITPQNPGFVSIGTTYYFSNCEIIGGLMWPTVEGRTTVLDCQFLRPVENGQPVRVVVGGYGGGMRRSYVDGSVSLIGSPAFPFEKNTVVERLHIGGTREGNFTVSDCNLRSGASAGTASRVTIRNCLSGGGIGGSFFTQLKIDSCYIIYDQPDYGGLYEDGGSFSLTRSIVNGGRIRIGFETEALFDHNTFYFDSLADSRPFSAAGLYSTFTNNIFISEVPESYLFGQYPIPNFEYNCIWGFAALNAVYPDSAPSLTNITANPLLIWDRVTATLAFDSPCIDAGNPNSPLDPDGTRADIGAHYFHHEVAVRGIEPLLPGDLALTFFPNPFNSSVSIGFSARPGSLVKLEVLDLMGRRVATPFAGMATSLQSRVVWNAASYPAGDYILRLGGADVRATHSRVTLIK